MVGGGVKEKDEQWYHVLDSDLLHLKISSFIKQFFMIVFMQGCLPVRALRCKSTGGNQRVSETLWVYEYLRELLCTESSIST